MRLGERTHKLHWTEVQRLEAGKNYVTLHLAGQWAGYPLPGSLSYVLDQLVPPVLRPQFVRLNRQTALNVAITGYDDDYACCGPERYAIDRPCHQRLRELRLG